MAVVRGHDSHPFAFSQLHDQRVDLFLVRQGVVLYLEIKPASKPFDRKSRASFARSSFVAQQPVRDLSLEARGKPD
jgi:hypothetical protein